MKRIYLDNASTTFLDPAVIDSMVASWNNQLGNASSIHRLGVKAASAVEVARHLLAKGINAAPEEVVFTSGGTESNTLAIQGYCLANETRGKHLIVSSIEHPSVLEVARSLTRDGFELTLLPVDREGFVSVSSLEAAIRPDTILVSIMHANNEVGTIQDIRSLASICRERGVAFHTDATQSFTKSPLDMSSMAIDLLTVSSHKIHGPKGVGALYVRKGVQIEALLKGGGHESGLRAGTLNTEGILGFGVATRISDLEDAHRMERLRDVLISRLTTSLPDLVLNGPRNARLCNNVNITLDGVSSKKLLFELDRRGIAVSVGSACSSGKKTPSHVLLAMGRSLEDASESLRISLSKWTTEAELETFMTTLMEIVTKERSSRVESAAG